MKREQLSLGMFIRTNPEFVKLYVSDGNAGGVVDHRHDLLKIEAFCGNYSAGIRESTTVTLSAPPTGSFFGIRILEDGTFCSALSAVSRYAGISVFVSADVHVPKNVPAVDIDSKFCCCDGQKIENWAGGEKFMFCTACKKEVVTIP
jgi:hypothetical protein